MLIFILGSIACSAIFVQKLLSTSRSTSQPDLSLFQQGGSSELKEEIPCHQPREFVIFTMPKTGTHLLRPFLENLTNKISVAWWTDKVDHSKSYLYDKNMVNLLLLIPNSVQGYWLQTPMPNYSFTSIMNTVKEADDFLVSHVAFSSEMEKIMQERNCVVFFILRDPRDWVISVIHHPNKSGVDIFGSVNDNPDFQSLDMDDKIDYIIRGTKSYYSASEVFQRFLPWLESPVCCPLRFEALIGPRGGACSEKEHLTELRKITHALQLDISDEKLLEIFDEASAEKINLVKGKAGTWKEYFNDDHKDIFKDKFGDLLFKLRYESDDNW